MMHSIRSRHFPPSRTHLSVNPLEQLLPLIVGQTDRLIKREKEGETAILESMSTGIRTSSMQSPWELRSWLMLAVGCYQCRTEFYEICLPYVKCMTLDIYDCIRSKQHIFSVIGNLWSLKGQFADHSKTRAFLVPRSQNSAAQPTFRYTHNFAIRNHQIRFLHNSLPVPQYLVAVGALIVLGSTRCH